MIETIRIGIEKFHDPKLVSELVEAYVEAKRNYYLGGLRLSAVEGGRFCEAAFRILQQRTTKTYTPLNKQLDTEKIIDDLRTLPSKDQSDSIRLHIPRALRMVYDIRNKRDTAHLADGIDPNLQDATLVISVLDWVLAEFVRLYHDMPPNEAQRIVEGLVNRRAPAIQEFKGFLKVLNPSLAASDYVLLLLYQCNAAGAARTDIEKWVLPRLRANLSRTLNRLTNDLAYLHVDAGRYFITGTGIREVERRKLYELPN